MKFKKLLMLVPVFALVACGAGGKTLTPEDAQERANQILASQETVEAPTSYKIRETSTVEISSTEDGTMSSDTETTIVLANQFYSFHFEGEADLGNGNSIEQELLVHAYVKGGEFVTAILLSVNGETTKNYLKTEIPEGEELTTEEVLGLGVFTVAAVMGDEEPDIGDYSLTLDTMLGETNVLEGVLNLYLSDEDIEMFGFTEYSMTAKSKGEGHLSLEISYGMSYEEEGITSTLEGTERNVWTNNLLTESYMKDVMTESDGTNSTSMIQESKLAINYSAKPSYPNLSGYTLAQQQA